MYNVTLVLAQLVWLDSGTDSHLGGNRIHFKAPTTDHQQWALLLTQLTTTLRGQDSRFSTWWTGPIHPIHPIQPNPTKTLTEIENEIVLINPKKNRLFFTSLVTPSFFFCAFPSSFVALRSSSSSSSSSHCNLSKPPSFFLLYAFSHHFPRLWQSHSFAVQTDRYQVLGTP